MKLSIEVPSFDFVGATDAGVAAGNAATFAAISCVLFMAAVFGRNRHLRH